MRNKFYFDELYEATAIPLHDLIAKIADFFDRWIIEGFCIGFIRWGTDLTGRSLRGLQTGNLQAYALMFALRRRVIFTSFLDNDVHTHLHRPMAPGRRLGPRLRPPYLQRRHARRPQSWRPSSPQSSP